MIATFALSPAGAADARVHDTQAGRIAVTPVATGLAYPWGFEVLSDGALLVNEIEGRMLLVSADGETRTEVAGVPDVAASGQGGLLDLALSPDFDTSGILYFTFSEPGEGGASTAAARARLVREGGEARLEDVSVIARMEKKTGGGRHFGSRVVPAPDGTLFVTLGDRGESERAQDPRDHAGSVLRVGADGSIPSDNPFAVGDKALFPKAAPPRAPRTLGGWGTSCPRATQHPGPREPACTCDMGAARLPSRSFPPQALGYARGRGGCSPDVTREQGPRPLYQCPRRRCGT